MDVIAVAARRDMVDALAAALRGAGLTAVGIDLSAFAMIRALSSEGETSMFSAATGIQDLVGVLETVHQEREVDVPAGRAVLDGILARRGELVLERHLRVVEEPADQRALAVVDAAAGEKPQQLLPLVLREVGIDVGRDQLGLVRRQK